ncbi:hypothetical protein F4778DRAFT_731243, partial [Xylariomycetidae sp. FL2044]
MAPHAISPPESTDSLRDLKSETEVYVRRMTNGAKTLSALFPLDTAEKLDQLGPVWTPFYDVISWTTLDTDLERSVLQHPEIVKLMPDIRRILTEVEVAYEMLWADRVAATSSCEEAWDVYDANPLHEFYVHTVRTEWAILQSVMGRVPESVAVLGSGPMPETTIQISKLARDHGHRVRVHSLDLVPSRSEQAKKVVDCLFGSNANTFESGDVRAVPVNLGDFDVVYFNAAVGSTTLEKEDLLLDVVRRMKSGSILLTRSTYSLKTMAYPPVQNQTPRIFKKLRPILSCNVNGYRGSGANATIILSKV